MFKNLANLLPFLVKLFSKENAIKAAAIIKAIGTYHDEIHNNLPKKEVIQEIKIDEVQ